MGATHAGEKSAIQVLLYYPIAGVPHGAIALALTGQSARQ